MGVPSSSQRVVGTLSPLRAHTQKKEVQKGLTCDLIKQVSFGRVLQALHFETDSHFLKDTALLNRAARSDGGAPQRTHQQHLSKDSLCTPD